tara:strand:+ start:1482 stop:1850 length:369 start_codon:yes stop_codon:yes gene_type:complete
MNFEELKEYIYNFLENEWCSLYNDDKYDDDNIYEFTDYWTNSENEEIYNEIENELNMKNIWDIIKYCEDEYELIGYDEPFSFNCKHRLLTQFIYFAGKDFGIEKMEDMEHRDEESDEEEAPS